jgi:hypothetical protein
MDSDKVKASIWEYYSLKGKDFLNRLSNPHPSLGLFVQDEFIRKSMIDHNYDQIDSKVGRRSDFVGIPLVASAIVNFIYKKIRLNNSCKLILGG